MVGAQRAPSGTDRQTNSLAVIALALALLPTLAAALVIVVVRSNDYPDDYAMFRAFLDSGATNFVGSIHGLGFLPFLLAVVACFRRPGALSDVAAVVTFVDMFLLWWLYGITPHRWK